MLATAVTGINYLRKNWSLHGGLEVEVLAEPKSGCMTVILSTFSYEIGYQLRVEHLTEKPHLFHCILPPSSPWLPYAHHFFHAVETFEEPCSKPSSRKTEF